ncbi:DUF1700 domain-containing protein [Zongyangia hominis]|uniref:DUF1700 domain-containing protein n=1 Tax=Zongyangia hominis TaxID=2763677 RepID=A0A926EA70_9FIRM|nr:DUF1700 domain-containing protein [Zongyangia hominis]MBC8570043.1 DUF1700 domain-containing protein [Zongyangia hominis]
MNASDFLRRLDAQLERLPVAERESALSYYRDYFADAGMENEQKVLEELGSPERLGEEIVNDYYLKNGMTPPPAPERRGMPLAVKIILWIFLGPIGFALLAALFAVLLGLAAIPVVLILAGGLYCMGSIIVMFFHLPTGTMTLGLGFVAAGLGLLLFVPVKALVLVTCRWVSDVFRRLTRKGGSVQ